MKNRILIISAIVTLLFGYSSLAQEEKPYGINIDQASFDLLTLANKRLNDLKKSSEFDQALTIKAKIISTDVIHSDYIPSDVASILPNFMFDARIDIIKGDPDLTRINFITNYGDMYLVSEGINTTAVIPDQKVWTSDVFPKMLPANLILPDDNSGLFTMINIFGGIPFGSYFMGAPVGTGQKVEFVEKIAPEDLRAIITYRGIDNTPSGLAHIITIRSTLYKQYIKVWILQNTLDIYQISIEDERGTEVFIVFTEIDTATPSPLCSFNLDTTGMTYILPEELIARFMLKILNSPTIDSPMVADFFLSHDPVARTGTVIVSSDGIDLQDMEDQLLCEIQYHSPSGNWTPLKTEYGGVAPIGRWNAELTIPEDAELGKYSFRVRFIDTSKNASKWSEYIDIMTVTPAPPRIVKTIPTYSDYDVPVTTKIKITFSKPMDKKSAESAFSMISGTGKIIKGTFEWDGNTMIFTPNVDLEYNTRHLVRLAGTAMDTEKIGFDGNYDSRSDGLYYDDYVWVFMTAKTSPMLAFAPVIKSVYKGDIFDLKVAIKNVSALHKFSFKVTFDPSQLEVVSIKKESFMSWKPISTSSKGSDLWKNSEIDNLSGFVSFACDGTRNKGVNGSGYLATISFKCKGVGKITATFSNISMSDWNGNTIPITIREAE
ncbi:MAG: Ig-like domain-containing protein, partial [Candidatus Poribacteria bacterium]